MTTKTEKGRTWRPCRNCGEPTLNLSGYCDSCSSLASGWQTKQAREIHERRIYHTPLWRRLRAAVFRRDGGLCRECLRQGRVAPGTEVDHVVPLSEGGGNDLANLQLLCRECHRRKTSTPGAGSVSGRGGR